MRGRVKSVIQDRGFGFIAAEGKEYFFHFRDFQAGLTPTVGAEVEFTPGKGPKGLIAQSITLFGEQRSNNRFLNPYNFVRFMPHANKAFIGKRPPSSHALFPRTTLTGELECKLSAVTPLFISSAQPLDAKADHPTYRFFEIDGEPVIPAGSLRGMLRSTFESVTNSCFAILDNTHLTRRMDTKEAPGLVPAIVVQGPNGLGLQLLRGREKPGFNRMQAGAWVRLYDPLNRRTPSRPKVDLNGLQHGDECWAVLRPMRHQRFSFWNVEGKLHRSKAEAQNSASTINDAVVEQGYLCVTGQNMDNKHDERFFFGPSRIVNIPTKVREEYELIVREYQERHETDKQTQNDGKLPELSKFMWRGAKLKPRDLVYAGLKGESVEFIVPVQLSRRVFPNSVVELLPRHLHPCHSYEELCPACRLFGWVKPGGRENSSELTAYAGRVSVSYGRLVKDAGREARRPLAELSSPKPTTTFFYLKKKDGSAPHITKREGYIATEQVLRGRKVYRHHSSFYWLKGAETNRNRTIEGAMKAGSTFSFTVRFNNLTPEELGALAWTLTLEKGMHHRLGFGKPLGLGSVSLTIAKATVLDLATRYSSTTDWGKQNADIEAYITAFKSSLKEAFGKRFEELDTVIDLKALLSNHPDKLPVHYPIPLGVRVGQDNIEESFRWFVEASKQESGTLPLAHVDRGLVPMGKKK